MKSRFTVVTGCWDSGADRLGEPDRYPVWHGRRTVDVVRVKRAGIPDPGTCGYGQAAATDRNLPPLQYQLFTPVLGLGWQN